VVCWRSNSVASATLTRNTAANAVNSRRWRSPNCWLKRTNTSKPKPSAISPAIAARLVANTPQRSSGVSRLRLASGPSAGSSSWLMVIELSAASTVSHASGGLAAAWVPNASAASALVPGSGEPAAEGASETTSLIEPFSQTAS
jgi:hypothetical protein